MNKCLYCYETVEDNTDFHKACAKKIFGSEIIPSIEFNLEAIEELAKEIIVKSVAVTVYKLNFRCNWILKMRLNVLL